MLTTQPEIRLELPTSPRPIPADKRFSPHRTDRSNAVGSAAYDDVGAMTQPVAAKPAQSRPRKVLRKQDNKPYQYTFTT